MNILNNQNSTLSNYLKNIHKDKNKCILNHLLNLLEDVISNYTNKILMIYLFF